MTWLCVRWLRLALVVRSDGHHGCIERLVVIRAAYRHESSSPHAIAAANEAARHRDVDRDARVHVGLLGTRELAGPPIAT